jgi:hypothetical protein
MKQKGRLRDRFVPLLLMFAGYAVLLAVLSVSAWLVFREIRSWFVARG